MTNIETIEKEILFGCSLIGILVLDMNGAVISCNDRACAMLADDRNNLKGNNVSDIFSGFGKDDAVALAEDMKMDRAGSGVIARTHKTGAPDDLVRLTAGYVNNDPEPDGLVVYLMEIAARGASCVRPQLAEPGYQDDKTEFLCNIFHGIQDSIIIHDLNGKILSYNAKTLMLLGLDMETLESAKSFRDFSPEDINSDVCQRYFKEAAEGHDRTFTWQLKRPSDGTVLDVEVFFTRINKRDEAVVLSCIKDITDKKKIEDELVNSEKRYRQLVEYSPDGIVIHRDGIIKYVNPAGARIFGGTEEDVMGREVIQFFPDEDREMIKARLKQLYENEQSMPVIEGRMVRLDGRIAFVEYAAIPFKMDGRTAVQVVIRDVTQKKIQEDYIKHMALHDTLTGLPNRGLLTDRIAHSLERRKRDKYMTAVLYIDLDGFKPVNDTLGHAAGDKALKEIADRLSRSIRKSDTAARIGGDEFVILLDAVHGRNEIEEVAERVLENINKELVIDKTVFHIGASVGIGICPEHTDDPVKLLAMADRAMYKVKESGKNRYLFCDGEN